MSEPKVLFEDHGNIAVIKLNRPEKRNALDPETVLMFNDCLLYTSPSPRDSSPSRMPSSA